MATYTRTSSNLLGSPGSPSTVTASSSSTSTPLSIGSGDSDVAGMIALRVTIGSSAPATNPTVQFQFSLDGTVFYNDGGPFVVPISSVSTSYDYSYDVPVQVQAAQVVVTNGTTNSITCYVQGVTLGVS